MADARCPDPRQVSAYLLGSLDEAEAGRLSAHLEDCAACQNLANAMESHADELLLLLRRSTSAADLEDEPGGLVWSILIRARQQQGGAEAGFLGET